MCACLCMQIGRQRCPCVMFSKQRLKRLQHAGCVQRQKPPTHNSLMFFTSTFPLLDVVEPGSTVVTVMYYCSKLICLICNSLRSLCKINNKNNPESADLQQAAHFPHILGCTPVVEHIRCFMTKVLCPLILSNLEHHDNSP